MKKTLYDNFVNGYINSNNKLFPDVKPTIVIHNMEFRRKDKKGMSLSSRKKMSIAAQRKNAREYFKRILLLTKVGNGWIFDLRNLSIDDIGNKPTDLAMVAACSLLFYLKGKEPFIIDVYYKNEILGVRPIDSEVVCLFDKHGNLDVINITEQFNKLS